MENTEINNPKLKALRNLINLSDDDLKIVVDNLKTNKLIQLLDYIHYLGLSDDFVSEHRKEHASFIPPEREDYFENYKKIILSLRTMEHNLSTLRINPFTNFEKSPPLFFGMGGGSKELCKGLPFDVLAMLLTGEKLKRELNLSECRILLANRITYTNIPKSEEFSEESIDNVMKCEKELLNLVIKKFGFKNWKIFLQTDLEQIIGSEIKKSYEELIQLADKSSVVGGHHYSIEMADIWSLVGQKEGGIKLGWFMRNLDHENGGYIMDEQPFHARFSLFMALQNLENNVTLSYAKAGARLYPGPCGALEKESPYICYQPKNRLLLSPFEQPIKKLKEATLAGGGFQFKYYRNLISGIIDLFEELVLSKNNSEKIERIPVEKNNEFRGSGLAHKADFIKNYIFEKEDGVEEVWLKGFPK